MEMEPSDNSVKDRQLLLSPAASDGKTIASEILGTPQRLRPEDVLAAVDKVVGARSPAPSKSVPASPWDRALEIGHQNASPLVQKTTQVLSPTTVSPQGKSTSIFGSSPDSRYIPSRRIGALDPYELSENENIDATNMSSTFASPPRAQVVRAAEAWVAADRSPPLYMSPETPSAQVKPASNIPRRTKDCSDGGVDADMLRKLNQEQQERMADRRAFDVEKKNLEGTVEWLSRQVDHAKATIATLTEQAESARSREQTLKSINRQLDERISGKAADQGAIEDGLKRRIADLEVALDRATNEASLRAQKAAEREDKLEKDLAAKDRDMLDAAAEAESVLNDVRQEVSRLRAEVRQKDSDHAEALREARREAERAQHEADNALATAKDEYESEIRGLKRDVRLKDSKLQSCRSDFERRAKEFEEGTLALEKMMEQEVARMSKSLAECSDKAVHMKTSLLGEKNSLASDLKSARSEIDDLQTQLSDSREEIDGLLKYKSRAETESVAARSMKEKKLKDLEAQLKDAHMAMDDDREYIEELKGQVKAAEEHCDRLKLQLSESQHAVRREKTDLEGRIRTLEQSCAELEIDKAALEEDIGRLRNKVENDVKSNQSEEIRLRESNVELKRDLEVAKEELESTLKELEREKDAASKMEKTLRDEVNRNSIALQQAKNDAKIEMDELRGQLELAKRSSQQLEKLRDDDRDNVDKRIRERVKDLQHQMEEENRRAEANRDHDVMMIRKELGVAEEANRMLKQSMEGMSSTVKNAQEEQSKLHEEVRNLTRTNTALEDKVRVLEGDVKSHRGEASHLESEVARLTSELRSASEAVRREIEDGSSRELRMAKDDLQRQKEQVEKDAARRTEAAYAAEAETRKALDTARAEILELHREHNEAISALRRQLAEAEHAASEAKHQVKVAQDNAEAELRSFESQKAILLEDAVQARQMADGELRALEARHKLEVEMAVLETKKKTSLQAANSKQIADKAHLRESQYNYEKREWQEREASMSAQIKELNVQVGDDRRYISDLEAQLQTLRNTQRTDEANQPTIAEVSNLKIALETAKLRASHLEEELREEQQQSIMREQRLKDDMRMQFQMFKVSQQQQQQQQQPSHYSRGGYGSLNTSTSLLAELEDMKRAMDGRHDPMSAHSGGLTETGVLEEWRRTFVAKEERFDAELAELRQLNKQWREKHAAAVASLHQNDAQKTSMLHHLKQENARAIAELEVQTARVGRLEDELMRTRTEGNMSTITSERSHRLDQDISEIHRRHESELSSLRSEHARQVASLEALVQEANKDAMEEKQKVLDLLQNVAKAGPSKQATTVANYIDKLESSVENSMDFSSLASVTVPYSPAKSTRSNTENEASALRAKVEQLEGALSRMLDDSRQKQTDADETLKKQAHEYMQKEAAWRDKIASLQGQLSSQTPAPSSEDTVALKDQLERAQKLALSLQNDIVQQESDFSNKEEAWKEQITRLTALATSSQDDNQARAQVQSLENEIGRLKSEWQLQERKWQDQIKLLTAQVEQNHDAEPQAGDEDSSQVEVVTDADSVESLKKEIARLNQDVRLQAEQMRKAEIENRTAIHDLEEQLVQARSAAAATASVADSESFPGFDAAPDMTNATTEALQEEVNRLKIELDTKQSHFKKQIQEERQKFNTSLVEVSQRAKLREDELKAQIQKLGDENATLSQESVEQSAEAAVSGTSGAELAEEIERLSAKLECAESEHSMEIGNLRRDIMELERELAEATNELHVLREREASVEDAKAIAPSPTQVSALEARLARSEEEVALKKVEVQNLESAIERLRDELAVLHEKESEFDSVSHDFLKVQQDYGKLVQREKGVSEELQEKVSMLERCRSDHLKVVRELQTLKDELTQRETALEEQNGLLEKERALCAEIRLRAEELAAEVKALKGQAKNLEEGSSEKEKKLTEQLEAEQLRCAELTVEKTKFEEQIEALHAELNSARAAIAESEKNLKDAHSVATDTQTMVEGKIKELTKAYEAKADDNRMLTEEIGKYQEKLESLMGSDEQLSTVQKTVSELMSEKEKIQANLQATMGRYEEVTGRCAQAEEIAEKQEEELKAMQVKLSGLEKSKAEMESMHRAAIERLNQEHLQESNEVAEKVSEFKEQYKKKVQDYKAKLAEAQATLAEERKSAAASKSTMPSESPGYRKDCAVCNKACSMQAAMVCTNDACGTPVHLMCAKVADIDLKSKFTCTTCVMKQSAVKALIPEWKDSVYNGIVRRLEDQVEEARESGGDVSVLEARVDRAESLSNEYKKQLEFLNQTLVALREQSGDKDEEIERLKAASDGVDRGKVSKLEAEVQKLSGKIKHLEKENSELEESLQQEEEDSKKTISKLRNDLKEARQNGGGGSGAEIAALEKKVEEQEAKIERLKSYNDDLRKQVDNDAASEAEGLREERDKLKTDVVTLKKKHTEAMKNLDRQLKDWYKQVERQFEIDKKNLFTKLDSEIDSGQFTSKKCSASQATRVQRVAELKKHIDNFCKQLLTYMEQEDSEKQEPPKKAAQKAAPSKSTRPRE